jgi:hypothetical protein
MGSVAVFATKKKTAPSAVSAPVFHRDRLPSVRTDSSAGGSGSSFAQVPVMPAQRHGAESCPLQRSPGRCPFGGACHHCPPHVHAVPVRGIHRRAVNGALLPGIPPIVSEVLRSPGHPLDTAQRAFMESRFGHDFGRVRLHTDQRAAASARAISAAAYTAGRDVVLPGGVADSRVLAHELAHIAQQGESGPSAFPTSISAPDDEREREADCAAQAVAAGRSFRASMPAGTMVHRVPAPGPPATLAGLTATRETFNDSGAPDAANCAAALPAGLGVDGPHAGANGMEMIFRIAGAIPDRTEFEITRTKATGTWERDAAGAWKRLGGDPAGTSDDHHDDDECLTPVGGRIFVVDTPGMGGMNPRGMVFPDGTKVSATATAAVRKHSFAEWVIARNRPLGIDWTPISQPLFHRWHSIVSVELAAGTWRRVDTPSGQRNEIRLGGIGTASATP